MNITPTASPTDLDDRQLLVEVKRLTERERMATAELVAALAELDARKLYLAEGCSSLFTYCTQVLHLSEHATYHRIEAARAARRYPVILDLLARGGVTLTAIGLFAPHLTEANHRDVLDRARHKSKRDVELIVASLHPRPPVPATVRKLPSHGETAPPLNRSDGKTDVGSLAAPPALSPPANAAVTPLAPQRFKLQLTMDQATHDKLRRVQDLMRHRIPNGDPAAIFGQALTVLLASLERAKYAATDHPREVKGGGTRSRRVPAAVRRAVWSRDGGRCAFVGASGRCTERGFLEFHHVHPYATGGETTAANLELRCRAHNNYEKDEYFGLLRESRPTHFGPPLGLDRVVTDGFWSSALR